MYDDRDFIDAIRELNRAIQDIRDLITAKEIQLTRLETKAEIDRVDLGALKKVLYEGGEGNKTSLLSRIHLLENQQEGDKESISKLIEDLNLIKSSKLQTENEISLTKESDKSNFFSFTDDWLNGIVPIIKSIFILGGVLSVIVRIIFTGTQIDIPTQIEQLERLENLE